MNLKYQFSGRAPSQALFVESRISKILLSGRDEMKFLQIIKDKLCSYYQKEFSEMDLIEEKRSTNDLFLEPELECTVDGKMARQLKSCDELLSLKLPKQTCKKKYLLLVGRIHVLSKKLLPEAD